MKNINDYQAKLVWKYFYELCKIPRCSGHTEDVQKWLINFAEENKLSYKQDKIGNVLIIKQADAGFEDKESVLLQSHMDMVCEKNSEVDHDFKKDPIEVLTNGDWITANGTTLGADDGIGVAMELALLADKNIKTGKIECLFTVDEEVGLVGATNIESGMFDSKIYINLDEEEDGQIVIGCAGGVNALGSFKYETEEISDKYAYFSMEIKGLKGGHSGVDINDNRYNAIKLLSRFVYNETLIDDSRICSFVGGNLSNAIPREAKCIIAVPKSEKHDLRIRANMFISDIEEEVGSFEPNFVFDVATCPKPDTMMTKLDTDRLLSALMLCPSGVISNSPSVEMVQTSVNLASVKIVGEKELKIEAFIRSSLESEKEYVCNLYKAAFAATKISVEFCDNYPGWNPIKKSRLQDLFKDAYKKLFDKDLKVCAVHAGLECGLLLDKYPGMDIISFGPEMQGVHSPDEKLQISTVGKAWVLLLEVLKNI